MTAEASDDEAKNAATARPKAAEPNSSSSRICTASPPVRKAGSTPTVATATASRMGRRFDASRSVGTSFLATERGMRVIIARPLQRPLQREVIALTWLCSTGGEPGEAVHGRLRRGVQRTVDFVVLLVDPGPLGIRLRNLLTQPYGGAGLVHVAVHPRHHSRE